MRRQAAVLPSTGAVPCLKSLSTWMVFCCSSVANPSVNSALSFVSNFPPCLQSAEIPDPGDKLSNEELLARLPHTGTIGGVTTFYFTFVYSKPYASVIPSGGIRADPYFPKTQNNCDTALFAYRAGIQGFVT